MESESKTKMSKVMVLAWWLRKTYDISFRESLIKSWKNIKLKSALKNGVVEFHFVKQDGSIRQAFGTLVGSKIPDTVKSPRKRPENVQVFFDCEKCEWRSFKKVNLL